MTKEEIGSLLPLLLTGAIVVFLFVVLFLVITLPVRIARRRGHPSKSAIDLCCVIGIFIWPVWLVALVWSLTGESQTKLARATSSDAGEAKPKQPRPVSGDAEFSWKFLLVLVLAAILFGIVASVLVK